MIINYAHRGASGYYPENTMLSFEKAIELGCDGIETDVQMTSDGVLVLIHDEQVNRTTNGTGWVKDYTYDDLKKLDAGSWLNKEFKSATIPTAEELLILAKEKNIKINFEIKTGIVLYHGIEQKLIDLIYKHGMENNIILSSFNHLSMVHCKKVCSHLKTGLLYMEGLYKPELYCKLVGADALHPSYYTLDAEAVKNAHKKDVLINTFTVNDENDMRRLIAFGVDGIITNYPDKLKFILDK